MLITKKEIVEHIRSNYPGYPEYDIGNENLIEENDFIVINDIHKIDETTVNLEKDIFVLNLLPDRQTNAGNIRLMCDSLNADGSNAGDEVYKAMEEHNHVYTKSYIKNGANWVTLKAFFVAIDKSKELIGTKNPRSIFDISKFIGLDKSIFDSSNVKLNLVDLRSLYELFYIETRKVNYDLIIQPVTTEKEVYKGNVEFRTYIISKYFKNFELHSEMKFDHEFQVNGVISGLSARKRRPFAEVTTHYYCYDLITTLKKDYSYLNYEVRVDDSVAGNVYVNNKKIAHKVLLLKKEIISNLSRVTKIAAPILSGHPVTFPKTRNIYDHENRVELNNMKKEDIELILKKKEGMLVYYIDETLYDETNKDKYSTVIVQKGEMYNAKYSLTSIKYVSRPYIRNIYDYGYLKYIDYSRSDPLFNIFNENKKMRQFQMIKMFETVVKQREIAIFQAKKAEEAKKQLEELNKTLEEKVADRTRQLQDNNRQKTAFFINIAHELKTPLSVIQNSLREFMKNNQNNEPIKDIKYNIDQLLRNMINFLDAEKLQTGQVFYNHNDVIGLSDMTLRKIKSFEAIADRKGLALKHDIAPELYVKADPFAIDRVINNLMDNAIKYNKENGAIFVSLAGKEDKVILSVRDTGIGISEEDQKTIFDPYHQISHNKRNIQGIGMGLYILSEIVKSLDGKIELESRVGEGSSFKIILKKCVPMLEDQVVSQPAVSEPLDQPDVRIPANTDRLDGGKSTLLIVEDNKSLLNQIRNAFEDDYNVLCAQNGIEAIKVMESYPAPDAIISDIMMDQMDGYTLLERLQEDEQARNIPFVFLTAKTTITENIRGLSLGAVDYVFKPFSMEVLAAKVRSLVNYQTMKKSYFNMQKAASLGTLSGSLIHEIVNPLAAIQYQTQSLYKICEQNGTIQSEKVSETFHNITELIDRINTIVKSLRILIYNKKTGNIKANISEIIQSIDTLISKEYKERIDFEYLVPKDLEIETDIGAMNHILMNIINNAIDSIENKGKVTVKVTGDSDQYYISISDTGKGIERKYINKIFDFDFTTKLISKGSGLGLYITRELIERLGLQIHVESELNKGTTFVISK